MKYLALLLLICFVSCKKETQKPIEKTPVQTNCNCDEVAYNWNEFDQSWYLDYYIDSLQLPCDSAGTYYNADTTHSVIIDCW